MELSIFQAVAPFVTFAITLFVLAEYIVLVPLKRNPGAKRLVFLLGAILVLLGLNLARALFGDYPYRLDLLATFFYILSISMAALGYQMWKDQREGVLRYRKKHPKE